MLMCVVALLSMMSAAGQSAPAQKPPADPWLSKPVDERTFRTYLDFFRYDAQLPFNMRVLDTEGSVPGVRRERLVFDSTAGVQVYARLYRPQDAPANTPTAIVLHGGVPRGKDNPNVELNAQFLARAGWNVLAIDMMYFGERRTDLLTVFTEQEKHERLYNQPSSYLAWVTQTVKDVGRSFDLLVREQKVDPARVVLIGISRGAIVGSIAAAVEKRFRSVALLYGAHFDALERAHLPAACNANYIGRISPRPLLAINGLHDMDHIKDASVEPLLKLAKAPREIIWADTGHQSALDDDLRARMLQWLQNTVK
ncbi:MAG: acetylxylan esterase [Acidobacteria bacterium]|nr:acetylxylan esterase [Acidobacteriota bacterium]